MKNQVKIYWNAVLLFLLFTVVWCLLSHFLVGIPYYIGALLCAIVVFILFSKIRSAKPEVIATTVKGVSRIKAVDAILIVVSILFMLFLPFISIINFASFYVVNYILAANGVLCTLFWLFTNMTDHPKLCHGNVIIGINIFALLVVLLMNGETIIFNAKLTLRMIVIVIHLCYTVSLFSYSLYRPAKENHIGTFVAFGFIMATMVFISLNADLDRSNGVVRNYTVVDVDGYHDSVTCITDDGHELTINYSAMKLGDRWYLTTYEGWFQEQYSIDGGREKELK